MRMRGRVLLSTLLSTAALLFLAAAMAMPVSGQGGPAAIAAARKGVPPAGPIPRRADGKPRRGLFIEYVPDPGDECTAIADVKQTMGDFYSDKRPFLYGRGFFQHGGAMAEHMAKRLEAISGRRVREAAWPRGHCCRSRLRPAGACARQRSRRHLP